MAFLVIALILVLLFVYTKSLNETVHNKLLHNYWIGKDEYKEIYNSLTNKKDKYEFKEIVIIMYIITIGYILCLLLILMGFYKYYKRKSKQYGNKWNWQRFIFGTHQCIWD